MPSHSNPTARKEPWDEYADLADLYLLRLVCGVRGNENRIHRSSVRNVFSSVFGSSSIDQYKETDQVALMELRLQEVEASPRQSEGPLFRNVGLLASRLGLSAIEQEILAFRVLVRASEELDNFLQSLGGLSEARLARILALALNRDSRDVEQGLAPTGSLVGSALVRIERTIQPFMEKLRLIAGLPDALLRRQDTLEGLISFAVSRAEHPVLSADDYPHLRNELELMCRYLQAAMVNRLSGVNVLLYGPPGVGKTQLVRVIAKQAGFALYEVASSGWNGEGLTSSERYASYRLNQSLFAKERNTIVLFDEVEDVFRALPTVTLFDGLQQQHGKAWINRVLEKNPVPAFWIANSVDHIDPASMRRFDYVLEVRNPPQSVRRRILGEVMAGLPVTGPWLDEQAAEEHFTPALAERAIRVLRATGTIDTESIEEQFRQIVGNNLAAQGHGSRPRYPRPDHYSFKFVNASVDLGQLCENLTKRAKGRLLLYGPPGSGKTAFAHQLAKVLDRPLLLKRASDLVSMWLGQTEKNIAGIFRDAGADGAVLLLDEADSFLQDRQHAVRSWEVTQVNELLTQMECFQGLFLCATNFRQNVDGAALRRFGLKIEFDYLKLDQSRKLYLATLAESGCGISDELALARGELELARLNNLTPGDFAAVKQQMKMLDKSVTPVDLITALKEESKLKPDGDRRPIGFAA